MSFNRLIFAAIIVCVLLTKWQADAPHTSLIGMALYILLALAVLVHIVVNPKVSRVRRVVALLLDLGFLSWQLHLGGELVAFFFSIYLWVILGNGFRFGIPYLAIAVPVATLAFGFVIYTTPFWYQQAHLSVGLLIGLIVLPAYSATLIRKLSSATRIAEEANKAKSLFLASVSHELRTPLTAIVGIGGLLRSTSLDAEQLELTETIDVAARSLRLLIDGLLDLSRIEAGRMPNSPDKVDLLTLLVEIRRMVDSQIRAKGLRFNIHVTPRTPLHLFISYQHLHGILLNLAANAVKFTASGGIVVAVDGAMAEGSATSLDLRIEVSDTGIGIAPQDQKRIFENFTQANPAIMNQYGGTGLGLAIARGRVGLLGGTIEVESELGVGSTFRVQLSTQPVSIPRPSIAGKANVTVVTRRSSILSEILGHLASLGVSVNDSFSTCGTAPPVNNDGGRILFVDHASRQDIDLSSAGSGSTPMIILLVETAAESLPDLETRRLCTSVLSYPLSNEAIIQAISIARRLSGAVETRNTRAAAKSAQPSRMPAAAKRRRVLLVDDNRTNQKVFSRILDSGGHQVMVADNGEKALDILEREANDLDIVLMDFNMPELDGLEVTKLFRAMSTGNARLPIIGLTADASAEFDGRWQEAGMDGCLTKPVDPQILLAAIETTARAPLSTSNNSIMDLQKHPRFRLATMPALDDARIANLRALGDGEFVEDLMSDFMADSKVLLANLVSAARRGDTNMFRSHAHALRSSALNVGAIALGDLCGPWGDQRSDELKSRAEDFATRAEAELARTREAIASLAVSRKINHI